MKVSKSIHEQVIIKAFLDFALNMAEPNVVVRTQLPSEATNKCNPQNIGWTHAETPLQTSRTSAWWCLWSYIQTSAKTSTTSTRRALCAHTREDDDLARWGSTAAQWFRRGMATLLHSLQLSYSTNELTFMSLIYHPSNMSNFLDDILNSVSGTL